MLLTSYPFLFFFLPLCVFLYFAFFDSSSRNKIIFLGLISAYFYYLDNGILLIILIFLTILTKLQIEKSIFNNYLYVFLTLLPLMIFKYSYQIYTLLNLEIPKFIESNFPIGLSFFTFQAIAYYFDKKRLDANESTFDIFTFLAFFPQLLAGPIVDISTFRSGIKNKVTQIQIVNGVHRLSIGLLKKFFLADTLSEITSIYINISNIESLSFLSVFILIFSYTFQIYFDFSGYCDIAIGIGLLFGFKLPENFNQPYIAKSFKEFWQRWHITLSNFFKEYVYIKLGGNRNSTINTYRNLWITFFCTAIWHGSSLTFLFWGFLHGTFMTIERLISFNKFFSNRLVTFVLISLSWVPFFAKSLEDVQLIYSGLFNFKFSQDYLLPLIVQNLDFRFIIVAVFCLISLKKVHINFNPNTLTSYSLLLFSIIIVISSSVDPFIYYKF